MAKLAKMKISASQMFLAETEKYSQFDDTVKTLGSRQHVDEAGVVTNVVLPGFPHSRR